MRLHAIPRAAAAALIVLSSGTARAQTSAPAASSAAAAAVAFFAAVDAARWAEAAALMDSADVEQYRRAVVREVRRPKPAPAFTVAELRRQDPSMPKSVAAYLVAQFAKVNRPPANRLGEFVDVPTADSLAALPAAAVAARWLEAQDPARRFQLMRREASAGCGGDTLGRAAADSAELAAMRVRHEVLGAVERDDAGWALFRVGPASSGARAAGPLSIAAAVADSAGDGERPFELPPQQLALRRAGGGWRVRMLEGSGTALSGGFTALSVCEVRVVKPARRRGPPR